MPESLSVDDAVWLAGQFSRPPLTKQQLANYRVRLQDERRGRSSPSKGTQEALAPGGVPEGRADA